MNNGEMFDLLEGHIGEKVIVTVCSFNKSETFQGILRSVNKYQSVQIDNKLIPFMSISLGISMIASKNEYNDLIIYYFNSAVSKEYTYKTHEELLMKKASVYGEEFIKTYNLKHPNNPIKF